MPPEGNAHQAEFSNDNKYFLAADEDFNPYRADRFFINGTEWPTAEVGGGTSQAALSDQELDGPLFYGGYGCPQNPTDDVPDAPSRESLGLAADQERILVMQRGPFGDPTGDYDGDGKIYDDDDACFPGEKAALAYDHGWDAVLLVEEVDAYAIAEGLDPADAFGFGDLSIHEFATDPTENLAYAAYYASGMRVFRFGESGLTPVGHYIAKGGSNFWGVETFVAGASAPKDLRGKTLFAGSDRDSGISIFRYTGG